VAWRRTEKLRARGLQCPLRDSDDLMIPMLQTSAALRIRDNSVLENVNDTSASPTKARHFGERFDPQSGVDCSFQKLHSDRDFSNGQRGTTHAR
jgi:hypothetical protein